MPRRVIKHHSHRTELSASPPNKTLIGWPPAPTEWRTAKPMESCDGLAKHNISHPVPRFKCFFLQCASSPLLFFHPAQISTPPRQFETLCSPFLFQKPSVQAESMANPAPSVASTLHSWFHAHETGTWGCSNLHDALLAEGLSSSTP